MASERLGLKPYENAVQSALAYDRCSGLRGGARLECVLDKALANVGALLAGQVEGRVATELDPRLANDSGALVSKAQALVGLYEEMGVPRSKLIFRVPATWAGIQAAQQLEGKGIATQVFMVYSLVQGVAAMQAGASVLQPNVGRVRDWFAKHPGVIRDPKGPREDSGFGSSTDPGLELVRALYAYGRKYHPSTRIMASGIRTREDALALSGCDYLVLGARVMAQLAAQATDQGYNDGLSAVGGSSGLAAQLTPALAKATELPKMGPVDQSSFKSGLGLVGGELLAAGLAGARGDVEGLVAELKGMATGMD